MAAAVSKCAPAAHTSVALRRRPSARLTAASSNTLEAPPTSNAAAERTASGAQAGPSTPAAAAAVPPGGRLLRSTPRRSSLLTVQLAPGGVLTSDVIARATGTSGAGDEGYHAVNRVAYQVQGVQGPWAVGCGKLRPALCECNSRLGLCCQARKWAGLNTFQHQGASLAPMQGVPGAYSEMAAIKACPGWEPLPCEQFETAFQALSQV